MLARNTIKNANRKETIAILGIFRENIFLEKMLWHGSKWTNFEDFIY